jgi:5-(carboxyamino)imidazole ribonucleotide synthase
MPVPRDPNAPPVVTMIGGGQLARMTHQAAIALGQTLRVLAASPDDPAAQVTPDVVIGAHTDFDALRKAAAGADALTFDHEHVPTELLEKLIADGVNVAPPPSALIHAQDKLVMRRRLEALGAPVPRFAEVTEVADVDVFAARVDAPIVVKTVRGGYDGRGVTLARDIAEARDAAAAYWPPVRPYWSRRRWPCGASWRRSSRAHRSVRARRGQWCRPCSATASASR